MYMAVTSFLMISLGTLTKTATPTSMIVKATSAANFLSA